MNKRWKYFWYIQLGKFIDAVTLWRFRHGLYAYWWLNIAKRPAKWRDADAEKCDAWLACEYCGKGKV